jgi:hypothetical protein
MQMAVAVRLPEEIVKDAQKYASLSLRSVPRQIEYWYRLGKIADENPDIPLDFIKGVLEGKAEMEQGEVSAFVDIGPHENFYRDLKTGGKKKGS